MTHVADRGLTPRNALADASHSRTPTMLLDPAEAPSLTRSSPHVMSLDRFAAAFGGSRRRQGLLTLIGSELTLLRSRGITPLCLLVGGSFVRPGDMPNDLDALVVYDLAPDAAPDAVDQLGQPRHGGLDLRFVPADAGPVLLIKMSCFFHTLYQSRNRGGDQASYLITLQD